MSATVATAKGRKRCLNIARPRRFRQTKAATIAAPSNAKGDVLTVSEAPHDGFAFDPFTHAIAQQP